MTMGENIGRTTFDELEQLLRSNESVLCAQVAERYVGIFPQSDVSANISYLQMVTVGAENVHRLAVIVAALYPSDVTLRREYTWTTTGLLSRYGIGLEQQRTLLMVYFASVRETLELSALTRQAVDLLEAMMLRVVQEVFSSRV